MEFIKACPICESSKLVPFLSCVDQTVSHETFHIVKCENCELLITNPKPGDDSISKYYLSEEYISHSGKSTNFIDKVYLFARTYTLRWKTNLVSNTESIPSKTILDYGCGTGEFLNCCKKIGWKAVGVEPSAIARKQATELTGIPIHENLEKVKEVAFDTITLWHVLEHIPNLTQALEALKSKLKPNGTIFIAVPNYKSNDGNHYRNNWAAYDVPRHLWHFSRKSMTNLLEKSKLSLISIIPMKLDAYYISILSEKYKNKGKLDFLNLIRSIAIAFLSNIKAKRNKEYSSLIYIVKNDME